MTDISTDFVNQLLADARTLGHTLPRALFYLLIGILVVRLVSRAIKFALRASRLQSAFQTIAASVAEIIMWAILGVRILTELGLGSIVVFLTGSVAAVALVMAAGGSTLISDIIAGLFLAGDHDFNIGDEVIAGEIPTLGTVESMDARRTRIRDDKGVLHVIPNSIVERKEWVVLKKRNQTTALIHAAKAARVLREAAQKKRGGGKATDTPAEKVRDNDQ
jgi:small-conductance mechanosensitive channel